MNVIGIAASSIAVRLARIAAAWLGLCLAVVLGVSGCSQSKSEADGADAALGRVELELVGQGSQGTLFRLRNAILTVQGPDRTIFFDTEQDPDRTSLSAVVPAGFYTTFLQEGWRLERVEDGKTIVNAALISSNPDFFDVFEGQVTRVALRFRAGNDVVITDPGAFEVVIEVEEEVAQSTLCEADADCPGGQTCCIAGFLGSCISLDPGEVCPLPDLTVSAEVAQASMFINQEFFPPDSCAIEEGCVVGSGQRRLLRFATMTPNIGEIDLTLGDPTATPGFEFAACHGHFHFNGYARYELLDQMGAVVATGHKQAFCLLDSVAVGLPGAPTTPRFHCGFQGLQRGWADIYGEGLDCQWVDITGVPDGDYVLRISINPDAVIQESDFSNNTAEIPVTLAAPGPVDPLAPCSGAQPGSGAGRECGWELARGFQSVMCIPGEPMQLGCGCPAAGVGSCGGDPMLRVCEGSGACEFGESLASIDDACGRCPIVDFICPSSGLFSVLVTAFNPGAPFTCEPARP